MAAKHRIGVIGHTGHGNYGHGVDYAWLEVPGCEIVAVADPDDEGRTKAVKRLGGPKGYTDYRKMLDEVKPFAVSIGPRWIDQHRDMVVETAERGAHIYMEKPMCRSLAEADEMVAICEKNNVKLAMAVQTRYSPRLVVVRNLIEDGQIGDVLELRGRGKEDSRGGGADLWVLGTHIMNLIHYLGGEPQWCFAKVRQNGHPITKADVHPGTEGIGPLTGDSLNAMYGMDGGVTAYFSSHKGMAGNPRRFALRILGSKGIIEITTGYVPQVRLLADSSWSPGRSGKSWVSVSSAGVAKDEPLADKTNDDGNVAACIDLLAAIEEDRQPEASIYEARTTVEMIASVFESQRLNSPVQFPLKNRQNPLELL